MMPLCGGSFILIASDLQVAVYGAAFVKVDLAHLELRIGITTQSQPLDLAVLRI
ncbi:hypothetical protein [Ahniella affigens]|nr:hypothetical protein [Ahniella affigens]